MRNWMSALLLPLLAFPALAQDISPEADKALWCATALSMLDSMGAYPVEAPDVIAVTRTWYRRAFTAFDSAGLSDAEVDSLSTSYIEELSMQLPDYLVSSDEDALRLNIHSCFET
jgi:hypothetical protein